jgi:hypothetical protein
MAKESPKMQELGPKKYYEKLEKINKHYDDHMAGKRDPKTGELYHPISYTDPSKPKYAFSAKGASIYVPCKTDGCDNVMGLKRTTRTIICSKCKKLISWERDEIEELIQKYA